MAYSGKWKWGLAQQAELRWWQWYLRNKDRDRYLEAKAAYWHRVLAHMDIQVPPGASVLDAGCGPAGIFMILSEQTVTAVDPLIDAYAGHLQHFSPTDYPWVTFRCGILEELPDRAAYSWIFCMNAINHVADLNRCLHNLARALQPDGKLLLGVDVHRNPSLKQLFRWLPGDILHPQQHSLSDYRALLPMCGLRVRQAVRFKAGRIFDYYLLLVERG